jgi:elongation factor 3
VRSQTRAIMKLTNCTFTYEGAAKPSLIDVSCALSLSSRVGILGPNGAGKSTLIKLLTVSRAGVLVWLYCGNRANSEGPVDTGRDLASTRKGRKAPGSSCWIRRSARFPPLGLALGKDPHRLHVSRRRARWSIVPLLTTRKTCPTHSQWRYQDGHDREMLSKASRALTEEDKRMMDTEITGKNGDKRRIEQVLGRQKLKKSFQYEVKFKGMDHRVSWGDGRLG